MPVLRCRESFTASVLLLAGLFVALTAPSSLASAEGLLGALSAPPAGGITIGLATVADPAALASAQSFRVESIAVLDVDRQQWLSYIPGAPAPVNTLDAANLQADSVVTIRRAGTPSSALVPFADPGPRPVVGTALVLSSPPAGGITQGVAGTNDPAALAEAQPFDVQSISALAAASQRWLTYVPGAPASVNTLHTGTLKVDSIVTIRRRGAVVARATVPAPTAVPLAPSASALPAPTPVLVPLVVSAAPTSGISALPVDANAEAVMIQKVNQERVARGLPALVFDPTMLPVARAHSLDMWLRDYFAHVNPDGLDPFDRMSAGDITFGAAGENLARGPSTEWAHQALMDSPGHRANILQPAFRRIAIGVVTNGDRGITFTQIFAD